MVKARTAIVMVLVSAGLTAWLGHGGPVACPPSASPLESLPASAAQPEVGTISASTDVVETSAGEPARNLFAFREMRTAEKPAVREVTTVVVTPPTVVDSPVPAPSRPAFAYRCIGTFGPAYRRFAAFVDSDGVVSAALGETIGRSAFVLKEIGLESVVVESVSSDAFTYRVEIGQ